MNGDIDPTKPVVAPRRLLQALFACASVPLIVACGGGGGSTSDSAAGASDPSSSPSSSPAPTPNPSPTPSPSPAPSASPAPSPTPTASPAAISGLHVVGNAILNAAGQTVVLHGIDKSGSEFACIQDSGFFEPEGSESDGTVAAIASWRGTNAVRVPMNEDCWLGINGAPAAYSGANYQNAIKAFVAKLTQAQLVPILDLHWAAPGTTQATGQLAMPNQDHSPTFWSQVATAFKGNSSVVFDVFNEPFPDNNSDTNEAWRCWRDGGTCTGVSFQVAGMQELVTAIRAAGATNVIMLGGVEYSNALTQWLTYEPVDPLHNLAASWHMYGGNICSDATCWNQAPAAVMAKVPLIAGEFGEDFSGSDCSTTLVSSFVDWMDARQGSYAAWSWNTWGGCLSLVSDVSAGTPTSGWGAFYKAHLATR